MKRIVNPSIFLTAMLFVLVTSVHATGFSSFVANEKKSLTGIQSEGKNELLFYRLEKNGSYTLISDTAGKYAAETDLKISKEENVEIYYRFRGSDYRKATYTGEMAKLKLDVGKVQLPHGLGNLTSGMFVYKGQWKTGKMEGTGEWEFIGNGEKYKGAFVNNLFQGEGNFTYRDGHLYIGSWANGKRNGKGEIYFPYQKEEFPICEFGSVKAIKLSVEWKNDTANGIGQLTYLVKSNKAGVPDEEVVLTNKREEPIYWKGFKATGTISAVVFTNGNQFKGEVKNGSVSDGELFYKVAGAEELGYKKGVWQNGLFTGKATLPITPKGFFKGYVKNDVRQGEGTMKFADGAIYSGNWENDNFSGQGKYQFTDGTYYEGMWKEGKQNGYGVRYNSFTKAYWKCNWKDNVPVDSGTVTSNSNNVITQYTGGVGGAKTDKGTKYFFEGFGRFKQIFPTEDTSMHKDSSYVGYFHEGLPHGKGEMKRRFGGDGETDMTEWTYTGEWVNGNKQGQGKQVTEFMIGFETYEGLWANGMKQGKGKLVSSGEGYESTYTGTWNDDKMVGYGEAISEFINPENGSVERSTYKGQFANDSRNGQGTEVSYEGTYTGNWKDGLRNGLGKMVYKDGRIYEGQWAGGPNGDGTLILANKSVQKGKFINGEFQKPFVCKQVTVGTEVWMAENLSVSKFRNGEDITQAKNQKEWAYYSANGQSAWCYYDFNPANAHYGKLYNWYAVDDPRGLAPFGWHVPENHEWNSLKATVGDEYGGKKLKSTSGWLNIRDADGSGNNTVGFNALAFGIYEGYENKFDRNGYSTKWWSATADWESSGADHTAIYGFSDQFSGSMHGEAKRNGLYVRLVKNKVQFSHEIGDYFQGGIVFNIWKNNVGEEHGLILDLVDLSESVVWSNITSTEIGASAQDKNNGSNNSLAIVSQKGHGSSAASLCLNSTNGGKDDWYLPSLNEASKILANYKKIQYALSNVSGGKRLGTEFYWLSTEIPVSETNFMTVQNPAWAAMFGSRNTTSRTKSELHFVRAIRAF